MATLAEKHVAAQMALRKNTGRAVAKIWKNLGSYDEGDIARFLQLVAPLSAASRRQAAILANTYIAAMMERAPLDMDADAIVAGLRNGATAEEVYRRPFVETWTALKEGQLWEEAVKAGLDRAVALAETDTLMSMRDAARFNGMNDPGIYGWRRVTNIGACDLCRVASTQRYHRSALMPIHDHCHCSVEPIKEPTGRIADENLYRTLDGEINEISKTRKRARIAEHGELGPVITDANHSFAAL